MQQEMNSEKKLLLQEKEDLSDQIASLMQVCHSLYIIVFSLPKYVNVFSITEPNVHNVMSRSGLDTH